jgi:Skp family chaperone for outer membrane proteins
LTVFSRPASAGSFRRPRTAALGAAGAAAFAMVLMGVSPQAAAQQQGPGWFMPSQSQPRAEQRPAARPASRPAPPVQMPAAIPEPQPGASAPEAEQQVQLPPMAEAPVPELPALPRAPSPPAAVIGVLGVPEVMRASTAGQQVERVIGERRQKLAEDAQKEQTAWRDLQQSLANQRSSLSADQVRTKERELQERVTNAQKQFRDRNTMIQQAAQYSLNQIERTLIGVIRLVSESRGMNLVLHRSQVALNVNEFDITEAVTAELNKVLPEVKIPPDGVSPVEWAKKQPGAIPPGQGGPAQHASATGEAAPPSAGAPASPAPAAAPAPAAPAPAAAKVPEKAGAGQKHH